jgi:hypothetical protein
MRRSIVKIFGVELASRFPKHSGCNGRACTHSGKRLYYGEAAKLTFEDEMLLGKATVGAGGVRRGAIALRIIVVAAGAALWANPLAAQPPQSVHALAEQAIQKLDLQTELMQAPESLQWQLNLPPEVLWLVIIIAVGALLYAFRDALPMLRFGRGGAWTADEAAIDQTGTAAPTVALGAADDLAAQGRFVEAMHVLLLQALADIRLRLDEQFADSMTSREILRSKHLSDQLRHPLGEVVSRVEWTYFGEHPAAQDDYLACRSSFSALARALYGGAAA